MPLEELQPIMIKTCKDKDASKEFCNIISLLRLSIDAGRQFR